jgi:hypothetical protein
MAETKDYVAHQKHLEQPRFQAHIWGGDEDEPYRRTFASREFARAGEAERWMQQKLPRIIKSTTLNVAGDIRKGYWTVDVYPDDEYGEITDAMWEAENQPVAFCFLDEDGSVQIDWEE